MIKQIGIVVDVFIPNSYNSNNMIESIYSRKIGFKILLYSGIEEIVLDESESVLKINKGNMVILKKANNYIKKYTNIELYTGDNY